MEILNRCQHCGVNWKSEYKIVDGKIERTCVSCGNFQAHMTLNDYYKQVASDVIGIIRDSFELDVNSLETEIWREDDEQTTN